MPTRKDPNQRLDQQLLNMALNHMAGRIPDFESKSRDEQLKFARHYLLTLSEDVVLPNSPFREGMNPADFTHEITDKQRERIERINKAALKDAAEQEAALRAGSSNAFEQMEQARQRARALGQTPRGRLGYDLAGNKVMFPFPEPQPHTTQPREVSQPTVSGGLEQALQPHMILAPHPERGQFTQASIAHAVARARAQGVPWIDEPTYATMHQIPWEQWVQWTPPKMFSTESWLEKLEQEHPEHMPADPHALRQKTRADVIAHEQATQYVYRTAGHPLDYHTYTQLLEDKIEKIWRRRWDKAQAGWKSKLGEELQSNAQERSQRPWSALTPLINTLYAQDLRYGSSKQQPYSSLGSLLTQPPVVSYKQWQPLSQGVQPFREPSTSPRELTPDEERALVRMYQMTQATIDVANGMHPVQAAAQMPQFNASIKAGAKSGMPELMVAMHRLLEQKEAGRANPEYRLNKESFIKALAHIANPGGVSSSSSPRPKYDTSANIFWQLDEEDTPTPGSGSGSGSPIQMNRYTRKQRLDVAQLEEDTRRRQAFHEKLASGLGVELQKIQASRSLGSLSSEQIDVITDSRGKSVEAAPGGGKSVVLAASALWDAAHNKVDLNKTVFLSVTHSGANALTERLFQIQQELGKDVFGLKRDTTGKVIRTTSTPQTLARWGYHLQFDEGQQMLADLNTKTSTFSGIDEYLAKKSSSRQDFFEQVLKQEHLSQYVNTGHMQHLLSRISEMKTDSFGALLRSGKEAYANRMFTDNTGKLREDVALHLYGRYAQASGKADFEDIPLGVGAMAKHGTFASSRLPGAVYIDEAQDLTPNMVRMLGHLGDFARRQGQMMRLRLAGDPTQVAIRRGSGSGLHELLPRILKKTVARYSLTENYRSDPITTSIINALGMQPSMSGRGVTPMQVAMRSGIGIGKKMQLGRLPQFQVEGHINQLHRSMAEQILAQIGVTPREMLANVRAGQPAFTGYSVSPGEVPAIFQTDRMRKHFAGQLRDYLASQIGVAEADQVFSSIWTDQTPSSGTEMMLHGLTHPQARSRSFLYPFLDVTATGKWDDYADFLENARTMVSRTASGGRAFIGGAGSTFTDEDTRLASLRTPEMVGKTQVPYGWGQILSDARWDLINRQGARPQDLPGLLKDVQEMKFAGKPSLVGTDFPLNDFLSSIWDLSERAQHAPESAAGVHQMSQEELLVESEADPDERVLSGMRKSESIYQAMGRRGADPTKALLHLQSLIGDTLAGRNALGGVPPELQGLLGNMTPTDLVNAAKGMYQRNQLNQREEAEDVAQTLFEGYGPGEGGKEWEGDNLGMKDRIEVSNLLGIPGHIVDSLSSRPAGVHNKAIWSQADAEQMRGTPLLDGQTWDMVRSAEKWKQQAKQGVEGLVYHEERPGKASDYYREKTRDILSYFASSPLAFSSPHVQSFLLSQARVSDLLPHMSVEDRQDMWWAGEKYQDMRIAKRNDVLSYLEHSPTLKKRFMAGMHQKLTGVDEKGKNWLRKDFIDWFSQSTHIGDIAQHLSQSGYRQAADWLGIHHDLMGRGVEAGDFGGMRLTPEYFANLERTDPDQYELLRSMGAYAGMDLEQFTAKGFGDYTDEHGQKKTQWDIALAKGNFEQSLKDPEVAQRVGIPHLLSTLAPIQKQFLALREGVEGGMPHPEALGGAGGIVDPHDVRTLAEGADESLLRGGGVGLSAFRTRLQNLLAAPNLSPNQEDLYRDQMAQVDEAYKLFDPGRQLAYSHMANIVMRASTGNGVTQRGALVPKNAQHFFKPLIQGFKNRTRTLEQLVEVQRAFEAATGNLSVTGNVYRKDVVRILEAMGHSSDPNDNVMLRSLFDAKGRKGMPVAELAGSDKRALREMTRFPMLPDTPYVFMGNANKSGYASLNKASGSAQEGLSHGTMGFLEPYKRAAFGSAQNWYALASHNLMTKGELAQWQAEQLEGDENVVPLFSFRPHGSRQSFIVRSDQLEMARAYSPFSPIRLRQHLQQSGPQGRFLNLPGVGPIPVSAQDLTYLQQQHAQAQLGQGGNTRSPSALSSRPGPGPGSSSGPIPHRLMADGGYLPPGEHGIAGERGPELVNGRWVNGPTDIVGPAHVVPARMVPAVSPIERAMWQSQRILPSSETLRPQGGRTPPPPVQPALLRGGITPQERNMFDTIIAVSRSEQERERAHVTRTAAHLATAEGQQRAFLDAGQQHMIVQGGPGTGKTETLARAVFNRIARGRITDPRQMLLLSSLHSGRAELTNRFRALAQAHPTMKGAGSGEIPDAETFASFAHGLVWHGAGAIDDPDRQKGEPVQYYLPMLKALGMNPRRYAGVLADPGERERYEAEKAGMTLGNPQTEYFEGALSHVFGSPEKTQQLLGRSTPHDWLDQVMKAKKNALDPESDYTDRILQGKSELEAYQKNPTDDHQITLDQMIAAYETHKGERWDYEDYAMQAHQVLSQVPVEQLPDAIQNLQAIVGDEWQDLSGNQLGLVQKLLQVRPATQVMAGLDPAQSLLEGMGNIPAKDVLSRIRDVLRSTHGKVFEQPLTGNRRSDSADVLWNNTILGQRAMQQEGQSPEQIPTSGKRGLFPSFTTADTQPMLYHEMARSMLSTSGVDLGMLKDRILAQKTQRGPGFDRSINYLAGQPFRAWGSTLPIPSQVPAIFSTKDQRKLFEHAFRQHLNEQMGDEQVGRVAYNALYRRYAPGPGEDEQDINRAPQQFWGLLAHEARSHGFFAPHSDITDVGKWGVPERLRNQFVSGSRVTQGGRNFFFASGTALSKRQAEQYLADPSVLQGTEFGGRTLRSGKRTKLANIGNTAPNAAPHEQFYIPEQLVPHMHEYMNRLKAAGLANASPGDSLNDWIPDALRSFGFLQGSAGAANLTRQHQLSPSSQVSRGGHARSGSGYGSTRTAMSEATREQRIEEVMKLSGNLSALSPQQRAQAMRYKKQTGAYPSGVIDDISLPIPAQQATQQQPLPAVSLAQQATQPLPAVSLAQQATQPLLPAAPSLLPPGLEAQIQGFSSQHQGYARSYYQKNGRFPAWVTHSTVVSGAGMGMSGSGSGSGGFPPMAPPSSPDFDFEGKGFGWDRERYGSAQYPYGLLDGSHDRGILPHPYSLGYNRGILPWGRQRQIYNQHEAVVDQFREQQSLYPFLEGRGKALSEEQTFSAYHHLQGNDLDRVMETLRYHYQDISPHLSSAPLDRLRDEQQDVVNRLAKQPLNRNRARDMLLAQGKAHLYDELSGMKTLPTAQKPQELRSLHVDEMQVGQIMVRGQKENQVGFVPTGVLSDQTKVSIRGKDGLYEEQVYGSLSLSQRKRVRSGNAGGYIVSPFGPGDIEHVEGEGSATGEGGTGHGSGSGGGGGGGGGGGSGNPLYNRTEAWGRLLYHVGSSISTLGQMMSTIEQQTASQGSEYRRATFPMGSIANGSTGMGTSGYFNFAGQNPNTIGGFQKQYLQMYSRTQIAQGIQGYTSTTNQAWNPFGMQQPIAAIMGLAALTGMDPTQLMEQLTTIGGMGQGGGMNANIGSTLGMLTSLYGGNLSSSNMTPTMGTLAQVLPLMQGTSVGTTFAAPDAMGIFQAALGSGMSAGNLPQVGEVISGLSGLGVTPSLQQQYLLNNLLHTPGSGLSGSLTASPELAQFQQAQTGRQEQIAQMSLEQALNIPGLQIQISNAQISMDKASLNMAQTQLAYGQASYAFNLNQQNQQYGPIGADVSRKSYFNWMNHQQAAGYDPNNPESAMTFTPSQPFGLQNEQFYAGMEHQRSMLILGQSPLLSSGAFSENMRYINLQENFYKQQLALTNAQRSFEKDWQQKLLDAQAGVVGAQEKMIPLQEKMASYQAKVYELQQKYLPIQVAELQALNANIAQQMAGQGPVNGKNVTAIQLLQAMSNTSKGMSTQGIQQMIQQALPGQSQDWQTAYQLIMSGQHDPKYFQKLSQGMGSQTDQQLLAQLQNGMNNGIYSDMQLQAASQDQFLNYGGQGMNWNLFSGNISSLDNNISTLTGWLSPTATLTVSIAEIAKWIGPLATSIATIFTTMGMFRALPVFGGGIPGMGPGGVPGVPASAVGAGGGILSSLSTILGLGMAGNAINLWGYSATNHDATNMSDLIQQKIAEMLPQASPILGLGSQIGTIQREFSDGSFQKWWDSLPFNKQSPQKKKQNPFGTTGAYDTTQAMIQHTGSMIVAQHDTPVNLTASPDSEYYKMSGSNHQLDPHRVSSSTSQSQQGSSGNGSIDYFGRTGSGSGYTSTSNHFYIPGRFGMGSVTITHGGSGASGDFGTQVTNAANNATHAVAMGYQNAINLMVDEHKHFTAQMEDGQKTFNVAVQNATTTYTASMRGAFDETSHVLTTSVNTMTTNMGKSMKDLTSHMQTWLQGTSNQDAQGQLLKLLNYKGTGGGVGAGAGESHPGFTTPHVNAEFGQQMWYGRHQGVDFSASQGTPLAAFNGGKVTRTGFFPWGGEVDINLPGTNLIERYLHLSQIGVSGGQLVKQGQRIGLTGGGTPQSGFGYWSRGPHSHVQFDQGDINHGLNPWPIWALTGVSNIDKFYGLTSIRAGGGAGGAGGIGGIGGIGGAGVHLSQGGVALSPTHATLADGGEPEAIVPLSRLSDVLHAVVSSGFASASPLTSSSSSSLSAGAGGKHITIQNLVGTLTLPVTNATGGHIDDAEKDSLITDTMDILMEAFSKLLGTLQQ